MPSKSSERDEWLRLMVELGQTDRAAYRELRQEAWQRVERSHDEKTPEELAEWGRNAS